MESIDIAVEDLRDWLEAGRPVVVLDIRPEMERREWSIPGSVHADIYDALRLNRPSTLDTLSLPSDQPVVAVCAMGRTSLLAVEALRRRGVTALSLTGGMRAWSLAWNIAEMTLPGSETAILQIRRTGKGCLSYVVASEGQALVVDPCVDPAIYMKIARDRGLKITHILDTHVHADHLSRARMLAVATGAQVCLPDQKRVSYSFHPLQDRDVLRIGSAEVEVLSTPGHTMESACYYVDGRALLTGDTLFPAAVGRPDLAASVDQARERANALHRSLQSLNELPAETWILAGHTSEPIPFDGRVIGAPLSLVRENVQGLGEARETFVERLLARIPPNPPNHLEIVRLNESGHFPEGDPTELEAGANRCAVS